jgi:rhodanese-related sulfurtransferase
MSHRKASSTTSRLSCVACKPSTTTTLKRSSGSGSDVLTHTTTFPSPWLQALHRQAIPRHSKRFQSLEATGFAPTTPCQSDCVVTYCGKSKSNGKSKGKPLPSKVVYWASAPCDLMSASLLKSAECAYGNYANMGVAVRKGNNTLEFVLQTPRPYMARQKGKTNSKLWCRHLHFVEVDPVTNRVAASNKNVLFTLGVFPCTMLRHHSDTYECKPLMRADDMLRHRLKSVFIGFEMYMAGKAGDAVGVNAALADSKYPPISSDDIVLNWKDSVAGIARQMQHDHRIREHGVHTPLMVYCTDETCPAAQVLIEKLCEAGYCNVYYLKGGVAEALQKTAPLRRLLAETSHPA